MRIGEVARRTGLTAKTLRYYENLGLLPAPPRTQAGYRTYDTDHLERLHLIRGLQQAGLSLSEIGTVLPIAERARRTPEEERQLDTVLERLDRRLARALNLRRQLAQLADYASDEPPDTRT